MQTANLFEQEARDKIARAFGDILSALKLGWGLDIDDPNFTDTPKRVSKAYAEIFSGVRDTKKQLQEVLSKTFPCNGSDSMILMRDIETFSMCPHHFLPTLMNVHIAYIPSKDGRVLGLSKLARIADILAKRPVLQEKYTADITAALMEIPGCQGAACLVEGKHCCMMIRGISKSDAVTITSSLRGVFEDEDATRQEFLDLALKKR